MGNRDGSPAGGRTFNGKRLRILFVSSFLPQYKVDGGIAAHLGLLKRELEELGHTIFHLTSIPDQGQKQKQTKTACFVSPALRKRVPLRYHVNMIREYRKIRSSFAPDVVHVHSMSGLSLLAREKKIPVFVTIHSLSTPCRERGASSQSWPARCFRFIERYNRCYFLRCIFRNAARVILVSKKTEEEVLRTCPGLPTAGAEVLSPGIDLNRFYPRSQDSARRDLGIENTFLLLFVGRMVEAKKPLDIVRAMPAVLARFPDTRAVLIGDGPDFENCVIRTRELGLAEHVQFLRGRTNHELPVYYNAADIFINPTGENETFGLATGEAMACGTPVVISREGASTGVAGAEEAVIYDGVEELSSSIIMLLENRERRLRVAGRGMELVKKYSAAHTVSRLNELYRASAGDNQVKRAAGGSFLFFLIMAFLNSMLDAVKHGKSLMRQP